jgi:hypothetical protein
MNPFQRHIEMLVTLDKEVYEDDLEAAMADENHK